jgi:hypothetical protein
MATKSKPKPAAKSGSKPKFGSPAWDQKYGTKKFTKKGAK